MTLAPGASQRFLEHDAEASSFCGPTGAYIADLEQNKGIKTRDGGPLFPCMLTHGLIASWQRQRCACGPEHLGAQGINMFDNKGTKFSSDMKNILSRLSRGEQLKVAGNGICIATYGAWMLYVLCNTKRRPKQVVPRVLMPRASDESADDFATLDDGEGESDQSQ